MHKIRKLIIFICLAIIAGGLLSACRRAQVSEIPASQVTKTPSPTTETAITSTATLPPYPAISSTPAIAPTQQQYPYPGGQFGPTPTAMPYVPPVLGIASSTQPITVIRTATQGAPVLVTVTSSTTLPQASPTTVVTQYPGPAIYPTTTIQYPGPGGSISTPYPGFPTSTRPPSTMPAGSVTTPRASPGTASPILPAPTSSTPGVTPTELPPRAPLSPPPPGSTVTIWHSWNSTETAALQTIIQSFQGIYPDVTFSLRYVPKDDLYATYEEATYYGDGPSLLLGPAEWGPGLFDEELIADLDPFVPPNYLSTINPAALASGVYSDSLVSLPLSQHGMVLFRNSSIIDTAPVTFSELDAFSKDATHAGIVGSYLERGAQFSAADIQGLGGLLMDENGYPAFNNDYGLEWFELLTDYDVAGAVTFNTNWDLDMFKRGRVGIIIDGTWNISLISDAIGKENLAINPWPTYSTGHMSGWVEADSVFLNSSTTGNDQYAALSFIGYLLDPNVQMRLAEVGHIPSVNSSMPRDPLIKQAMEAFSSGTAYPIAVDAGILKIYLTELDKAIYSVFVKGVSPTEALVTASENITKQLDNMQTMP